MAWDSDRRFVKHRLNKVILSGLLAVVIVHSLLPVGFMLSFQDGQPLLVFCSQFGGAHSAHEHHHHSAHGQPVQSSDDSSPCPFALAAGTALSMDAPIFVVATDRRAPTTVSFSVWPTVSRFITDHPIRGPPLLS